MRLPASHTKKIRAAVCAGEALVCLQVGAAVGRAHSERRVGHTSSDPRTNADHQPDPGPAVGLTALTYELLDAHSDTARLAKGLEDDRSWAAHLDYLRALQRKGRESLARTTLGYRPGPQVGAQPGATPTVAQACLLSERKGQRVTRRQLRYLLALAEALTCFRRTARGSLDAR
jgi:hypothetical protein